MGGIDRLSFGRSRPFFGKRTKEVIKDLKSSQNVIRIQRKGGYKLQRAVPTWVSNFQMDMDPEGNPSELWMALKKDPKYINTIVAEMTAKKEVMLRKCDAFHTNHRVIDAHELYGIEDQLYVLFTIKGKNWCLWTVAARSAKELNAVGTDDRNQTNLPLFVKKTETGGLEVINSI